MLGSVDNLDHKALRMLNCLITAVTVYSIWREHNLRFFNYESKSIQALSYQIRTFSGS